MNIEYKLGTCAVCKDVVRFQRPGGGPWFCAQCGEVEGRKK